MQTNKLLILIWMTPSEEKRKVKEKGEFITVGETLKGLISHQK